MNDKITDFGFEKVPEDQKAKKVAEVFDSVAAKYDIMNDLMSGGMHRLWKASTVRAAGVRPGMKVLDIAGGTGDLSKAFLDKVGPSGEVWLTDINESMLAFGLRNMPHKDVALSEMRRVIKPGGKVLVLEFSKVNPLLAPAYDLYSFQVLPKIGQIVAQDSASYQYLAESIRMHPDQETLKSIMLDSGFDQVKYTNFTAGVVALHQGTKFA